MKEELLDYLRNFEQRLYNAIYTKCVSLHILEDDRLPEADDIKEWWKSNAPLYMVDAVREFNGYPTVVLAWASFLGMAVASQWDRDWEKYKDDEYPTFYGNNGFDNMDENIMENYLHFKPNSRKWEELTDVLRSVANETLSFIRHENIEGGTEKAFHVLAKSLKLHFVFGAAIELHNLGYKWEKAQTI